MSDLKVLVVGASVAGPVAAYWLAKAGAKVTVIERVPSLRTNGQNVDIRTSGVTVMRRMAGMEEAVRAKGTSQEGIRFVRADGGAYATIMPSGDTDQQTLSSEFEIFRGDLAQILYDLTKDDENIEYVFGEQIASIQHKASDGGVEEGPITVEFANGFPTSEWDLVVACDGATSRTRAMGLGCGVRDYLKPINCWASYWSADRDMIEGSKLAHFYSAVGGRATFIGPDPSGLNRCGVMSVHPRDGTDATLAFREVVKQGDQALKKFVADFAKGAGWKTDQILESMMNAKDFYASEIVQVMVPSLSKGRFVLCGDAGYCPCPFTGAGTTLAITGAYVLAGEINQHKGDLTAGLKAYETRMRPIIDDLQKIPPGITAALAPQTSWGIWLRNMIIGFIFWSRILEWAGKFYSSAFGGDKFGIPHYEFAR